MNGENLDACLSLVADRRRRGILNHLRHNGNGKRRIDNLVKTVYQAEQAATDNRQMSRDQFAIQLYHVHLPKLADHGVIEHDHERGTIEYRPDEQVEAVLERLPEEPILANL